MTSVENQEQENLLKTIIEWNIDRAEINQMLNCSNGKLIEYKINCISTDQRKTNRS